MKTIIAIILLSVVCAIPAGADDYKIDAMSKDPVQLDVAIRFNAIEPGDVIAIMDQIKEWHGTGGISTKACKLEYTLSKPAQTSASALESTTYGVIIDRDTAAVDDGMISMSVIHTVDISTCFDNYVDAIINCNDYVAKLSPKRYCCED